MKDNVSWEEVLEIITEKDINLQLADEMLRTRSDFSNGVKTISMLASALTDDVVGKAVIECCENWEGDGRTFRDCEYSYDYFFGKVSKELLEDYQRVSAKVERF